MKSSSYTLIPQTVFSTATENYDGVSPDFAGVPVKAAAYYTKNKSIQTVSWYLDNLEAVVYIEATLDSDPETADWFELFNVQDVGPVTENDVENVEGNFTWIRARVEGFTAGEIIKISLSY